ncbi:MAG: response regulator [Thermodesulfobacteriota bacterium]|nr:response regulator [Thermodesulfobacteriota bacterium]
MSRFKQKEFMSELEYSLSKLDSIKVKALLEYFDHLTHKGKMTVLYKLSKVDDAFTLPLLGQLASKKEDDKKIRDKIYELLLERSFTSPNVIEEWLANDKAEDKIIFIQMAGELQMDSTVSILEEILNSVLDNDVINATIKALGEIGSPFSIPTIADYVYSNNPESAYEAIRALGEIGDPVALKRLSEAVGRSEEGDSIILDILASNQDQDSLCILNEMLSSHFSYLRNMAKDHLIKIGSKAIPVLLENLKQENSDLLIHTLNVLGLIGDSSVDLPIRKLLHNEPADSNVRFAAYEALGFIKSTRSAMSLAGGLSDPEYQVRIAAAKAIDRNLSDVLIHGLKNLIEPMDEDAANMVGSFIDAEADKIFDVLVGWKPFQMLAVDYLMSQASHELRDHFTSLLRGRGDTKMANTIAPALKEEEEVKGLNIYVVDDSKLMLNIYTKKLGQLGYNPLLFQYPAEALEVVKEKKPDLLITDLNMPEINGLQLTKKIREKYSPDELPIMMITTQSDLEDEEGVGDTGIDMILHKPFSDDDLKEGIQKLTIL